MKRLMTVAFAAVMVMSGTAAFAQASGAMANGAMSNDAMSKGDMSQDAMGKNAMSHDTMKKGDKMKKPNAMGMDHPASGAMAQ